MLVKYAINGLFDQLQKIDDTTLLVENDYLVDVRRPLVKIPLDQSAFITENLTQVNIPGYHGILVADYQLDGVAYSILYQIRQGVLHRLSRLGEQIPLIFYLNDGWLLFVDFHQKSIILFDILARPEYAELTKVNFFALFQQLYIISRNSPLDRQYFNISPIERQAEVKQWIHDHFLDDDKSIWLYMVRALRLSLKISPTECLLCFNHDPNFIFQLDNGTVITAQYQIVFVYSLTTKRLNTPLVFAIPFNLINQHYRCALLPSSDGNYNTLHIANQVVQLLDQTRKKIYWICGFVDDLIICLRCIYELEGDRLIVKPYHLYTYRQNVIVNSYPLSTASVEYLDGIDTDKLKNINQIMLQMYSWKICDDHNCLIWSRQELWHVSSTGLYHFNFKQPLSDYRRRIEIAKNGYYLIYAVDNFRRVEDLYVHTIYDKILWSELSPEDQQLLTDYVNRVEATLPLMSDEIWEKIWSYTLT